MCFQVFSTVYFYYSVLIHVLVSLYNVYIKLFFSMYFFLNSDIVYNAPDRGFRDNKKIQMG